jgi:curved DNA-binding protein CbpA
MSEKDRYCEILGLRPEVSKKEIVEAYKVLVKVWNPDRFSEEKPIPWD